MTPVSGFLLLPILLIFLSDSEIGLWYVFIAISGWPSLLYLGLSPAFSRNIVYCLSGARALSKTGAVEYEAEGEISWHLLKCVMRTSRLFYVFIAIVTFALLLTAGSAYISFVINGTGIPRFTQDAAWVLFSIAMMFNVYFQYTDVYLRGFGDIAATSKAQVLAKTVQLIVTPVLLFFGLGLVGAAFGFVLNSVIYRLMSFLYVRRHNAIIDGLNSDSMHIRIEEIKNTFSNIFYMAWRDGIVMISLYIATQISTLICSAFLSLQAAGSYAILLQFSNAICIFASSYASSSFPEFQSAYAQSNLKRQVEIAGGCTFAYWTVCIVCTIGVAVVALPILSLLKPEYSYDVGLFLALAVYTMLLNHHSMYCSLIMCMNEIPYACSYIISSTAGLILSVFFVNNLDLGLWGLIFGQGIAQLAYNNWHWPRYVAHKLQTTYTNLLKVGFGLVRKGLGRS